MQRRKFLHAGAVGASTIAYRRSQSRPRRKAPACKHRPRRGMVPRLSHDDPSLFLSCLTLASFSSLRSRFGGGGRGVSEGSACWD